MRAEGPLAPIAVRWACLAGAVFLAAVPVYVFVEPAWRALVARLASALVLGIVLLDLRGILADRLALGGTSGLDDARDRRAPAPDVPLRFLDLIKEVRVALRSRRYFETVLWPRLTALTPRPLARPAMRRGRGPSLAGLSDVIAVIEKQP